MPATLTTNPKRRAAFGKALAEAMRVRQITQMRLGEDLGDMRQSSISAWRSGNALPPDIETVFRLEKVLKVPAGHLSRVLGFMPVERGQLATIDVTEAVMTDGRLDAAGRRMVLGVYDELIANAKRRHPSARKVTKVSGTRRTRAA
jgi:transcriptional regulator with XRE-family HTH domain